MVQDARTCAERRCAKVRFQAGPLLFPRGWNLSEPVSRDYRGLVNRHFLWVATIAGFTLLGCAGPVTKGGAVKGESPLVAKLKSIGGEIRVDERGRIIEVNWAGVGVGDADLVLLKDQNELVTLFLSNTRVTDAGLDQLRELPNLRTLGLAQTQVSDAGLVALRQVKSLRKIYLFRARVTEAGVKEFQKAVPGCAVEY